jgi:hypothetical protein
MTSTFRRRAIALAATGAIASLAASPALAGASASGCGSRPWTCAMLGQWRPVTPGDLVSLNPQPLPPGPGDYVSLNPQPIPPGIGGPLPFGAGA